MAYEIILNISGYSCSSLLVPQITRGQLVRSLPFLEDSPNPKPPADSSPLKTCQKGTFGRKRFASCAKDVHAKSGVKKIGQSNDRIEDD